MSTTRRLAAVVPTVGRSPWLRECLAALRREGCEVVVVDSAPMPIGDAEADRVLRPGRALGFAAATNLGIAATATPFVATVNDDAIVEPGWAAALLAHLEADPTAGAAQGVNLVLAPESEGGGKLRPYAGAAEGLGVAERVDGAGIGWNRAWQAIQLGRGGPPPDPATPAGEVWGVSATAAVHRRAALVAAALPGGDVFDRRLGSYYEDVDLAGRLRAAGWGAAVVPRARARHAGSASGRGLRFGARHLVTGNRLLVLARLLGRSLAPRLPRVLVRDLADLWHAFRRPTAAAGIVAGWGRAARLLPFYVRAGPPLVPLADLRRLSPDPPP